VVGISSKRISPPLVETRSWQGPLAPQALPWFLATMDPSDSPAGRTLVMFSHGPLVPSPTGAAPPEGVSQVPDDSVDARRPPSPPGAGSLHVLVAGRAVAGFPRFGRLATPKLTFHEAGTGSLIVTAGTFAFSGFVRQVALPSAQLATWRTSNCQGPFLP